MLVCGSNMVMLKKQTEETAMKLNVPKTSKRKLLKSGVVAAATLGTSPMIWSQTIKDIKLLQIGGSYSNMPEIAKQASKDLGFTIEMQAVDSNTQINRTLTQPKSFDVNDLLMSFLPVFAGKGLIQPVDASRYKYRDDTVSIWTMGKNKDGSAVSSQGTSPSEVLYYESKAGAKLSGSPTQWWSGVPSVYNADTLGIRPDLIGRPIDSWAELLNPKFGGKVALVDVPSTGIMDVAMAMEASGQMKYKDKGNITRQEIDKTMDLMVKLKKSGHFRAFWTTFDQSVNLMASGEVVIQSMWSPAVTAVRSRGLACSYPRLKEGFRGWGSVLAPQAHLTGMKLDAFYEYANWYNSGWVGSFMARQGYYSSVLKTAQAAMKPEDWNFWYEGKAAVADVVDPYGNKIGKTGDVRDGGSYWDRMGKIACWDTKMTEDRHLTRRWNEFVSS
jgi:putative spermidine/putrescine transport system substrate-binding protein